MIMEENNCRGCGNSIYWIKTVNGKNMPVDTKKITVITSEGKCVVGYSPHWSSCVKAENFRTKAEK